jgi:hypothetical protein
MVAAVPLPAPDAGDLDFGPRDRHRLRLVRQHVMDLERHLGARRPHQLLYGVGHGHVVRRLAVDLQDPVVRQDSRLEGRRVLQRAAHRQHPVLQDHLDADPAEPP